MGKDRPPKPLPPPSARALDAARAAAPAALPAAPGQSVHEQMTRQVRELLADAEMSEDEKQQILIALSCPCCGTSGLSLRGKLSSGPVAF